MGRALTELKRGARLKSFAVRVQGLRRLEALSLEKLTLSSSWSMVCHSTTSPLLHVEQMFKPLRLCPSGVSLSTGSLEQQCQPLATCLGPCEVSAVAIKLISRVRACGQMLCKHCLVLCFLLWQG